MASGLLEVYTKNYKQHIHTHGLYYAFLNPERPIFYRVYIPVMLRDPHIWYGMEILKGPIVSKAKYEVESEDEEVAEFADRQIKRFWARGITKALECLSWGYSGNEVLYEFNEDSQAIEFKDLRFIHPRDCRAVIKQGAIVAMQISGRNMNEMYLKNPKFFWAVHNKRMNRWYGRSRLEGAFDTWWEIWQPKGYRGIRHLWFYKNAFSGGTLHYPDGSTQDEETGTEIPNVLIAQEMLDKKETGASLALPNRTGDNRDWEWEDAKGIPIPEGLLDYGDVLRDELWEGIGVPPEVARQEDSGSFAGRRVPQQAFYSYLQEIANEVMYDFDEQILQPLVRLRFGATNYEVHPISILQTLQEEEMGLVTGSIPGQEGEEEMEGEEGGNQKKPLSNGRIEDRDSNAFNLSEKAQKNAKKKESK